MHERVRVCEKAYNALKAQRTAALLRDIQPTIVEGFSINPSNTDIH